MRNFGRYHIADSRDRKHTMRRLASARTFRYWGDHYWRGDQGETPQCVGYAWAHLLAAAPVVQRLDPTGIYTFAQFIDEWAGENYDGTSVRAGAKALHHLGVISGYEWAWDEPTVRAHVLESGPVVMGTNWYQGMATPDAHGNVKISGKNLGGHAWLVTGVNVNHQLYRCLNSWGNQWGLSGYFYVSFRDMSRLIREQGEACRPTEIDLRGAA